MSLKTMMPCFKGWQLIHFIVHFTVPLLSNSQETRQCPSAFLLTSLFSLNKKTRMLFFISVPCQFTTASTEKSKTQAPV